MHVRSCSSLPGSKSNFTPISVEAPAPVEFELDNFKGRCIFIHRPSWTYDNPETAELYPYRQLFHNKKRLWEWRLQGKFTRRPGVVYVGIELEEYVPVNFATRSLMRVILPLVQAALQCKTVYHEVGDPSEEELRPTVVSPIWAADNTLVHDDPSEAPDLASPSLPSGMSRKAARQYWETLWAGGGPSWEGSEGPTYTFALWGPSQLLDLRAWAFRKLPLMWGRELAMEPFCGRQPVHVVVYELSEGAPSSKHYQSQKTYAADIRMCQAEVWRERAVGETKSEVGSRSPERSILSERASPYVDDDCMSFCSAVSGDSPDLDPEQHLLAVEPSYIETNPMSPASINPSPLSWATHGQPSLFSGLFRCFRCRRRRPGSPTFDQLV